MYTHTRFALSDDFLRFPPAFARRLIANVAVSVVPTFAPAGNYDLPFFRRTSNGINTGTSLAKLSPHRASTTVAPIVLAT